MFRKIVLIAFRSGLKRHIDAHVACLRLLSKLLKVLIGRSLGLFEADMCKRAHWGLSGLKNYTQEKSGFIEVQINVWVTIVAWVTGW